jgi:MFS family permease
MQGDGLAPSVYGSVIAFNGILIVAGQLVVPKVLAGRSHSRVLAASTLMIAVGFGLTALAGGPWFYALTVLVWTVGEMAHSPSNSAVIAELSPAHLRGRYQSVFSLSFSIAALAAPIVGGWVIQHHGSAPLWIGCFVLGLVAAAGHLAAGPARGRRMERLRATEPAAL